MVRYCGYEIGKDITCEQMERLFVFVHANYDKIELLMLDDKQLRQIARENKTEWW